MQTTVIGSYPKPAFLVLPNWFTRKPGSEYCCDEYSNFMQGVADPDLLDNIRRAQKETLDEHCQLGIDVVTDGDMSRENYIFHFCRRLKNMDFSQLSYKVYRNGACKADVPTVRGPLTIKANDVGWCAQDWLAMQAMTSAPVKYTIPGPMTITNTTYNDFYDDMVSQCQDLAKAINQEIVALVVAGCRHIQVDEPLLVRDPDFALRHGIDILATCFENVGSNVDKAIHLCCGYPNHLDQPDYLKADKDAYFRLAEKLDAAGFDAISIEDAHRRNDLELFAKFKKSTIILGCVKIASSKVESVEEIVSRTNDVLRYIPASRLRLAPDCGLGFLPPAILRAKLQNMVAAAKQLSRG